MVPASYPSHVDVTLPGAPGDQQGQEQATLSHAASHLHLTQSGLAAPPGLLAVL